MALWLTAVIPTRQPFLANSTTEWIDAIRTLARNPEVRRVMSDALRFWRERGIDGFRLDALDRLLKDEQMRDDPPASAPPLLPLRRPPTARMRR